MIAKPHYLSDPIMTDDESYRILVCPSGFKESLLSHEAAESIESGIKRIMPGAQVIKAPLVDGGEGFTEGLVAGTGGKLQRCTVMGPTGEDVDSFFGFLGGEYSKTAVIEMAAAAGLRLVPREARNPTKTTTYGVGQLISAAMDAGAERILIGCGDSGTCDGGIGMLHALGARILTEDGKEIQQSTNTLRLLDLDSIDVSGLDSRLAQTRIDVACNWHNVLCGSQGVARVFGPQKGASPTDVEQLELAMNKVASAITSIIGSDISTSSGSGASGGLGAGLVVIGATLHPRFDIIRDFFDIDHHLPQCNLVITAEGGLDYQTPFGKIPSYVAASARRHGVPVVALAGSIGPGAATNYDHGIHAYASIVNRPMDLNMAFAEARTLLADAAEMAMRLIVIGRSIGKW